MTAAETLIRPHDILTIEPECIIDRHAIHPEPGEAWKRGREFACYSVPSRSHPETAHLVVYNHHTKQIYCVCDAAQRGLKCRHVKSVLFLRAYNEAYRLYEFADLADLQAQDETLARMERGALVPVRGWRALKTAIGDLVLERTRRAA
jgi:hypothetical protein